MPAIDPQSIAPIALAAAAGWLLFGDRIRSAWGTWGSGGGDKTGGDLIRLVSAADLLIKHFDSVGDPEGSQAARTAAGRLFAAKEAKPPSLQDWIMQGKAETKQEAKP